MNEKQLIKFIKVRNDSYFNNNFQFQIDANECGIDVQELGNPKPIFEGDIKVGYQWETRFGTLEEKFGKLSLIKK